MASMDADHKPSRRWPAYSLRTLFVVVTVFACWLGYQLNWIRERYSCVRQHEYLAYDRTFTENACDAPWPLRLFGERGIPLFHARYDDDLAEIQRLFPETTIYFGGRESLTHAPPADRP